MASVVPGIVFQSDTPVTATTLNLLGQPTVSVDDNEIVLADLAQVATNTLLGRASSGTGNVEAINIATSGIGYRTGAGGAVTQSGSRTTGVTLDTICGSITLVSAAGTASWQSFTVTNSLVAATDTIIVNQKSGTDLNMIHVTAVAAGSFQITFATTGGTTSEQPVFNFAVFKSVAA